MTAPTPQTKANQLLAQAVELAKDPIPNEFAIARLKRDARAEIQNDAVFAHLALGAAAALELDIEALHEHHRIVLGLADDAQTRDNYAISLQIAGLFSEAWQQERIASQKVPENLSYLQRTILWATIAGAFEEAIEMTEILKARSINKADLPPVTAADIASALERFGVGVDEYRVTSQLALEVLREHKIPHANIHIEISDVPEDRNVYLEIAVGTNSKTAIDLECELATRLNETLPEWHADKLIFAYHPLL